MNSNLIILSAFLVLSMALGCNGGKEKTLFTSITSDHSGISFNNHLVQTSEVNVYTFRNFFNGSGVGVGDFNNDGLKDIYFAGNQVDNKLYLNKGDFEFLDATIAAGVACKNIWSTGVSVVDINDDGWDDIYVCKSGKPGGANRHNELFINDGVVDEQGQVTFTESSEEYGLADEGLSIHAAFFDYDRDGDLDCYLLNNSLKSISTLEVRVDQRNLRDTLGGNKLYKNENGKFIDVSEHAGIYGSAIGFGLGVTVTDVDIDGWPDLYVSNDFYERDYLYLNNRNGTFKECLTDYMPEISRGSMGADAGDLNNDGYPDFFVTDMLPATNERMKSKTQFENWKKYKENRDKGYHRQFTRNTLQISNGDGTYAEISRKAGVAASDWSWGALLFDMNMDGYKDIFVANGLLQDLTDQDYINFQANTEAIREIIKTEEDAVLKIIEKMPSVPLSNCAYVHQGIADSDPYFEEMSTSLGLGAPGWSNGSAYADLDDDGDYDLILNNINGEAGIYKNNSVEGGANYIKIRVLKSKNQLSSVIGARVEFYKDGEIQVGETHPMKGYQSTVDKDVIFGLEDSEALDSIRVIWPNGRMSTRHNISINQTVIFYQEEGKDYQKVKSSPEALFTISTDFPSLNLTASRDEINDFDKERLIMQMIQGESPKGTVEDLNNDGLDDLIITGGKGERSRILIQNKTGFKDLVTDILGQVKGSEHRDVVIADFNDDRIKDVYFVSGGSSFSQQDVVLKDALLLSSSNGYKLSNQTLPTFQYQSGSVALAEDWDKDGDVDLFVGSRYIPNYYGVNPPHYVLDNDGEGSFTNISNQMPDLANLGMITAAAVGDLDNDGDQDIVVVGEWMPVTILENKEGTLTRVKVDAFSSTYGSWNTVSLVDLDGDRYLDIIAGNDGDNSLLKASEEEPIELWLNDYDQNGKTDPIITTYIDNSMHPIHLRQDIIKQLPQLRKQYPSYQSYTSIQVDKMADPEVLERGMHKMINETKSIVLMREQKAVYKKVILPDEVQRTSIHAILPYDIDSNGQVDLILGGNTERIKPELGGYNAGYGYLLKNVGEGHLEYIRPIDSGISIKGEIRDFLRVRREEKDFIIALRNSQSPIIIEKR